MGRKMEVRTVVHNRTDIEVLVKEGDAGVYRAVCILRPGQKCTINHDPNATYREYWPRGERVSQYHISLSIDELIEWKSIDLVLRHDATEIEWKGITPRTSPQFKTAWKNASGKVEAVASFSVELGKDLKRVVIYRAQCAHLVRFCSERVQKIREIFGCSWYNSSHIKFAAIIQYRCQNQNVDQNFDIDHLDLLRKKFIGKGGYKKVHRCKWLGLDVAIATFELQRRKELLEGFEREAGFMATLHHPNVVDFYGRATQKDQQAAFLVMELMGEDLGHLIDKIMENRARPSAFKGLFPLFQAWQLDSGGPFSLFVTVDILMQIVEAMIHSHKHGVMHRDLKPGNCLVSRKSSPRRDMDVHYTLKVIDFGSAKLWGTKASKHTRQQGTVQFMAPEVWGLGGQYTYSADVFSFGMLCFQVITGSDPCVSPPFYPYMHADRRYELLSNGHPPTIPADCPADLSILMRKCWATTPEDRPTFKAIQRDLWDYRLLLEAQYVPVGNPF